MYDKIYNQKIQTFPLSQVTITESYRKNAQEKELKYLKAFHLDKLLAGFREVKRLPLKMKYGTAITKYNGWENTEIRGHTMGHYLSAMAQAYANTKDEVILQMLQYIIDELERCQLESGYLSAFEEELFDRIEQKKPAWVPWYTMHKIIAGLIQVYSLVGMDKALQIVSKIGDWVYDRTSKWDDVIQERVLAVEYGGMNDCLYELYQYTEKKEHLEAAHKFDELALFTEIRDGKDILNDLHANTTIPKFLGALNRYFVLGETERFYLEACISFWDMVVEHHTYITGGNSEWEHFGMPDILDAERTNCNCETCNTYNMLRLSSGLFQITGEKKYADFYEQTLINAILSSQNPETGMTTYFQPMASGYFKVYHTPFDKFWCCTGTGMENFTKLNDAIYFYKEDTIYVNQYVSSVVDWKEKKVKITQISEIPKNENTTFVIICQGTIIFTLKLRIPDWVVDKEQIVCIIQGEKRELFNIESNVDGYLSITREWKEKDIIELILPMNVKAVSLQDNKKTVAFQYGPIVLSAGMGMEDMTTSKTGVMVTIPSKNIPIKDFIVIKEGEVEEWLDNIEQNLIKRKDMLAFTLKGTDEDDHLVFTPHFMQHTQRYGIYFSIVKRDSKELTKMLLTTAKKQTLEKVTVDIIPVGNDQYELEHNIQGMYTQVKQVEGHRCRYMGKDGWFSYEITVEADTENSIVIAYYSHLEKDTVILSIDGTIIAKEKIKPIEPWEIYYRNYQIPISLTNRKRKVVLKFETEEGKGFGGIFDVVRVVTEPI